MQGRFKMEYRLFTIVRYNYRDYNTPSKPNMHARLKTMQGRQALKLSKLPGGSKTTIKVKKNLKAGDRREGRKLRKSEAKQQARAKAD